MSFSPHGTARLPLPRKFKFYYNLTRIIGNLDEDLFTFMITARWILLRVKYVVDKSCRENQNTHLMFSNFFFENHALYEIM
jgi:hypothetical protein